MGLSTLFRVPGVAKAPSTSAFDRFGRAVVAKFLSLIDVGEVVVELPNGDRIERRGNRKGPAARIRFLSWRGVRRLMTHGDIGFARGYLDGDWESDDIEALVELGARNGSRMLDALAGFAPFQFINWIAHKVNANTPTGSRRNIEAHYDLGNEFYRLWLDRRMIYSSAIYDDDAQSLDEAQRAKLSRVVETLRIAEGSSVLEIGGGWGGLAACLARAGAKRVTSVTISPSQLDEASALIANEKLNDRVEFKLQDYRDIKGRFDRIVSIEMIEAVGREFIPKYFETIRDRLTPGGLCVIQAITITEDRFATYCRRPDFIQRFVFPGGFLPSRKFLRDALEKADLTLVAAETFGESYALTLRDWRRRFLGAWPQIEQLGFDVPFKRLWEYYLSYCEAGFRSGMIDVGLYSIQHRG